MLAQGTRFLYGVLTGLLVGGGLYLALAEPRGHPVQLLPRGTPAPIQVHVAGAVAQPGVYPLPPGALVADAIAAAGGALPQGDPDVLNLAEAVAPGMRVFVPGRGTPMATPQSLVAAGAIDLNTATAAELDSLPGVGPSIAAAILRYREEHGPFQSVDELLEVPGIGPTRFEQLRSLVRVGG
jgi:competence protein ComEA